MLISTKGRYALRVVVDLAENQGTRYVPLKEVADRQEISEKYLEGILKSLVRARVLVGIRGKGGGYRLNGGPDTITVGRILRLTEISMSPVSCLDSCSDACERSEQCRTLPMWKKLDDMISGYIDSITVADLMRAPQTAEAEQPAETAAAPIKTEIRKKPAAEKTPAEKVSAAKKEMPKEELPNTKTEKTEEKVPAIQEKEPEKKKVSSTRYVLPTELL